MGHATEARLAKTARWFRIPRQLQLISATEQVPQYTFFETQHNAYGALINAGMRDGFGPAASRFGAFRHDLSLGIQDNIMAKF